jgi:hypothetical protein
MKRCAICRARGLWDSAWQPWGPHDDPRTAFALGNWWYRGFPMVRVCDACHDKIIGGEAVTFVHKGKTYRLDKQEVHVV